MKKKILIIDDDSDIIEFMKIFLETDYTVYSSSDGIDGFERFLEFSPEIVITDLYMPIMGGVDLIKKIREIDKTVILAISGFDERSLEEAFKSGANQILKKPFNQKELLEVIRNF